MQGNSARLAALVLLALGPGCLAGRILCLGKSSWNSTELLPHPGSCALYLVCDHGAPVVAKCPQGLHFNRDLQVCDWPRAAGCIEAMRLQHAAEQSEENSEQEEEHEQKPEEHEQKPEEPEQKPEEHEQKPEEPEQKPEEHEQKPEEPEQKPEEPEEPEEQTQGTDQQPQQEQTTPEQAATITGNP
ncbi:uncharacterized protein LOC134540148 [Bacillus rossius redtenbacheri]|uniref:uncharacterized protein LOC134540148 n=1 Tax=Bacillus rossius redtenbacheri TaxID=93214 RepID=UPI002FDD7751